MPHETLSAIQMIQSESFKTFFNAFFA